MKTRVVHINQETFDVYIGRPSIWGNPFVIGKDGTRGEVIAKYKEHLLGHPELLDRLPSIKGKILGCFCKPKACHGDVIAKLADALELLEF